MRFYNFMIESTLESTEQYIKYQLIENINDFLSQTIAKLNNKKPDEIFKSDNPFAINLDHLAIIMTGLRIISNPDYRTAITKDDVGMNPNDAKDLINVLNQIDKNGKDSIAVLNIFKALCKMAPNVLKKQREELNVLQAGDDATRKQEIQKLQRFATLTSQIFNKVQSASTSTRGVNIPSLESI